MDIKLYPKDIFKKNIQLIALLISASILGVITTYYFNYDYALFALFDLNTEKNIPTVYSAAALVFASMLLTYITFIHKKQKLSYIFWLILALIFLFLSLDEVYAIHEKSGKYVKDYIGSTSGLFFYAWVVPYGVAVVVFIFTYAKFLFGLPRYIMNLFLVSGGIFVLGAIIFEMLGARQAELYGVNNPLYFILYTCEESLEMTGIAIFIYSLLTYIVNHLGAVTITLDKEPTEAVTKLEPK
jgi:hypothetical protein